MGELCTALSANVSLLNQDQTGRNYTQKSHPSEPELVQEPWPQAPRQLAATLRPAWVSCPRPPLPLGQLGKVQS